MRHQRELDCRANFTLFWELGKFGDLALIRQHRGVQNRLGFAVLMCYITLSRHLADSVDAVPAPLLLQTVASQIKVPIEAWAAYGAAPTNTSMWHCQTRDRAHRQRLDRTAAANREGSKITQLAWLRQSPKKPNSHHMLEHIERLKAWQALDLPAGIGQAVHPNRLLKIAREGRSFSHPWG